jgi:hypothetical protein
MPSVIDREVAFTKTARQIIQILRYGPLEKIYVITGLSLVAGAPILAKAPFVELLSKAALHVTEASLAALGMAFLFAAALRLRRKIIAPPLSEGGIEIPAIKGPAPFGPQDAELFLQLGRQEELGTLKSWILDSQKPLIALMGESGVGKSSLLRAGLSRTLRENDVLVIYWEALPTEPEERLLHTIHAEWKGKKKPPASITGLAEFILSAGCVVVIDQFEQISPERHPQIFALLSDAALAKPPFRGKWLVSFRREYASTWREFELGLPPSSRFKIETLSIRKFSRNAGEKVFSTLAEKSRIALDQKVLEQWIDDVSQDGLISPSDIGIGLLVLSEAATESGNSFSLSDFRSSGGEVGILTRYLEKLLDEFPQTERPELLLALWSLVDTETDQRIAEGRRVEDLATIAHPINLDRFVAGILFLASSKARVLESIADGSNGPIGYRLVHERFIPALRRQMGATLADVDKAGQLLDQAFRAWRDQGTRQYLLRGKDLRLVTKHQDQLRWGDSEKRNFLKLSERRRSWAQACGTIGAALILGLSLYGWNFLGEQRLSGRLEGWGLPRDLGRYLAQLEELKLPSGVIKLDWLSKADSLRALDLTSTRIINLNGLPKGLKTLNVEKSKVSRLGRLPQSLRELDINFTYLEEEPNLPSNLKSLKMIGKVSDRIRLLPRSLRNLSTSYGGDSTLSSLPLGLESLELFGPGPSGLSLHELNLASLPSGLQELKLNSFDSVDHLANLPKHLQKLVLYGLSIDSLAFLPNGLKSLSLTETKNTQLEILPAGLEELDLFGLSIRELKSLQPSIQTLKIYGIPLAQLGELPPGLRSLSVFGAPAGSLEHLPRGLRVLYLGGVDISSLKGLPPGLEELWLFNTSVSSLNDLPPGLKRLSLYETPVADLRGLPSNIQELRFAKTKITELRALPQTIRTLMIEGVGTIEPANLPERLEVLDVSRATINSLEGLPTALRDLTLPVGQIKSLAGMPKTVRVLRFVERSPDSPW